MRVILAALVIVLVLAIVVAAQGTGSWTASARHRGRVAGRIFILLSHNVKTTVGSLSIDKTETIRFVTEQECEEFLADFRKRLGDTVLAVFDLIDVNYWRRR